MTADELIKVMQEFKALGLTHLKTSDIELGNVPQQAIKTDAIAEEGIKAEDIVKPLSVFEDLSEEEILYWSTPFFDELEAKKKQQQERLDNGEN